MSVKLTYKPVTLARTNLIVLYSTQIVSIYIVQCTCVLAILFSYLSAQSTDALWSPVFLKLEALSLDLPESHWRTPLGTP